MPPKLILFVGRSNSGKTTLITKLIPMLIRRGLKVASIKNTHHQVQLDKPGKDSWRHREAGSSAVMLLTESQMAIYQDRPPAASLRQIADRWFSNYDLVVSEGFKNEDGLKLEIYRESNNKPPLFSEAQFNISKVITDDIVSYPSFRFAQKEEIIDWICSELSL